MFHQGSVKVLETAGDWCEPIHFLSLSRTAQGEGPGGGQLSPPPRTFCGGKNLVRYIFKTETYFHWMIVVAYNWRTSQENIEPVIESKTNRFTVIKDWLPYLELSTSLSRHFPEAS